MHVNTSMRLVAAWAGVDEIPLSSVWYIWGGFDFPISAGYLVETLVSIGRRKLSLLSMSHMRTVKSPEKLV